MKAPEDYLGYGLAAFLVACMLFGAYVMLLVGVDMTREVWSAFQSMVMGGCK